MTHWLVNLDTGPGLTFVSQLDSGLDMSVVGTIFHILSLFEYVIYS